MPPTHDPSCKQIFSHPQMVRDLLRGSVKEAWVEDLDYDSLDRVSGEYVSDDLRWREDDIVWRVRQKGQWIYRVGRMVAAIGARHIPRSAAEQWDRGDGMCRR